MVALSRYSSGSVPSLARFDHPQVMDLISPPSSPLTYSVMPVSLLVEPEVTSPPPTLCGRLLVHDSVGGCITRTGALRLLQDSSWQILAHFLELSLDLFHPAVLLRKLSLNGRLQRCLFARLFGQLAQRVLRLWQARLQKVKPGGCDGVGAPPEADVIRSHVAALQKVFLHRQQLGLAERRLQFVGHLRCAGDDEPHRATLGLRPVRYLQNDPGKSSRFVCHAHPPKTFLHQGAQRPPERPLQRTELSSHRLTPSTHAQRKRD